MSDRIVQKCFKLQLISIQCHQGILPTIQASCEHGSNVPCGKIPERFRIITPLAMGNFAQQDWSSVPLVKRLKLFLDTLKGLDSMHTKGYMHRDISPKNLLVVALDPPLAAICDYGKAVRKESSTNSYIGPIFTLAPEVQQHGPRYDKRIDIWSLAYAWYRTLFPESPTRRVDRPLLQEMLKKLDRFKKEGEVQQGLADLMSTMLAWDPDKRISIEKALERECLQHAARAFPTLISTEEGSRKRLYEE